MAHHRSPYPLLALYLLSAPLPAQRVITTIAGTDWVFSGTAMPSLSAPLGRIASAATDAAGNVYMADETNHMVQKYDVSAGTVTIVAGNGKPGFSGDGGYAKNAGLNDPRGVTVDSQGNVYIGDSANFRVRKVTPDGIITTFAGIGVNAYAGENIPATQASLALPLELAADRHGNIYVTDGSCRVRRIDANGIISTFAGTGRAGPAAGDGGPATQATFNCPIAVAVDASDNVYISDWLNNRIRRVTPDGIVRTFAGTGENAQQRFVENVPATQATLSYPRQIAIAPNGAVYVADQGINRIRRIGTDGVLTTFAGMGREDFTGDGGPAVRAMIGASGAVAVDGAGNVYIGDTENLRIRKVGSDQIINTVAGNGAFRPSPNGAPADSSALNAPEGITLDANGHLFIANTNDHRVLELLDQYLYIFAGNGKRPSVGDGGPAPLAGLNFPSGVAFDSLGNLFIADQFNGYVRKVNPAGIISTFVADAPFGGLGAFPTGVATDANNNVYIADRQSCRIRKVTPAGVSTFFAGVGGAGYTGDGGPAVNARLAFPRGVATDRQGNVYIADTDNHAIRKVSAAGVISSIAGNGKSGYSGDGGAAAAATLKSPAGIWVDPSGVIFIADTGNNAIRQITPDGIITTVAGTGTAGFQGDGGDPTAALLYGPRGVTGDGSTLYISDTDNHRIRAITTRIPNFSADHDTLVFAAVAGASSPGAQGVNVVSDITGVAFTTTSDSPWLAATPASGTMPGAVQVTVDPSQLGPGTYEGTITISSPLANPPAQTIAVTVVLSDPNPPRLAAQPNAISLSIPEDAPPAQQTLFVANAGSGVLTFDASPSSDSGWLKAAVAKNTALPAAPGAVTVIADPTGLAGGATYNGSLNVTSPTTNESVSIPVTLAVTAVNKPKIVLSQTGLAFRGATNTCTANQQNCREDLPQCFSVLNSGQGTLDFTVTSDVPWLQVARVTCPYRAVSSVATAPEVVAQVKIGSMAPGDYQGHIQVVAPQADNSPQTVAVKLTVVSSPTAVGPIVRPTGLIFGGPAGQTPGSLDIYVYNFSAQSFHYSSSLALDGNWFTYGPSNADVKPSQNATTVRVYPNFAGLAPGAYHGAITLSTGYGNQPIDVLATVTGATGALSARAADKCAPTQLNAVFTLVQPDFTAQTGTPFPLELYVADDCGAPLTAGTVVASFSNGDPAINLVSLLDGRWTGTWTPANPADRVEIRVRARTADSSLAGDVQRTGNLQ